MFNVSFVFYLLFVVTLAPSKRTTNIITEIGIIFLSMALGSTQPLTEISSRNLPGG
jgi:hypothetical protein